MWNVLPVLVCMLVMSRMPSDCNATRVAALAGATHEPHLIAKQAAAHASHATHAALAQHRHLLRRRQVLVLRLVRLLPLPERLHAEIKVGKINITTSPAVHMWHPSTSKYRPASHDGLQ